MLLSTQTHGFSLLEPLLNISQIQYQSLTSPMLASSGSEYTRQWPNRNEEVLNIKYYWSCMYSLP